MSRQDMRFFDAAAGNEKEMPEVISTNSVVGIPALFLRGSWASGGLSTSTFPHVFISNGAAPVSGLDVNGTSFGVAAPSSFTGTFVSYHWNGPPVYSLTHDGSVGVRSAATPSSAALFVPWKSGDTLTAVVYAGSPASGNDRDALHGDTDTGRGVYGTAATTGFGVQGSSVSGYGVYATSTSGFPFGTALSDAATNTAPTVATFDHISSGLPVAGFGVTNLFRANTTTTPTQNMASFSSIWADPTHATRRGRLTAFVYDATTAREAWRIESNGNNAEIGFLGSAAIPRQALTGAKGGNVALANLITVLAAFGLISDGTS